jgi:hypothetical protein
VFGLANAKTDGPEVWVGQHAFKQKSESLKRVGLEIFEQRIHANIIALKESASVRAPCCGLLLSGLVSKMVGRGQLALYFSIMKQSRWP